MIHQNQTTFHQDFPRLTKTILFGRMLFYYILKTDIPSCYITFYIFGSSTIQVRPDWDSNP